MKTPNYSPPRMPMKQLVSGATVNVSGQSPPAPTPLSSMKTLSCRSTALAEFARFVDEYNIEEDIYNKEQFIHAITNIWRLPNPLRILTGWRQRFPKQMNSAGDFRDTLPCAPQNRFATKPTSKN